MPFLFWDLGWIQALPNKRAVGLVGQEGRVMRLTLGWGLLIGLVLGLVTFVLAR